MGQPENMARGSGEQDQEQGSLCISRPVLQIWKLKLGTGRRLKSDG